MQPIQNVSIIGGGTAGFFAALALKRKLPGLRIRVIRSKEIGVIGVGEGSTLLVTNFLHGYLGLSHRTFHDIVNPTWKLGIRFDWGPRPYFNYTLGPGLETRAENTLPKPNGFYCENDIEYTDFISACMTEDRIFAAADGQPIRHDYFAYHVENARLVQFLEMAAQAVGIEIVDDTVTRVARGEVGVESLCLASGAVERADLFVDCSGFRSIILGQAFKEPFVSYESSLFCERAIVGGWDRAASSNPADQVIKPYTTAQTMDAGWAWQIEHEHHINRGYVYSPQFISDADAEAEFRRKNPCIQSTRIVKFTSGRYERAWVNNVVAIGNAAGFVEPMEATSLGVIATQCVNLAEVLARSDRTPRATQIELFNRAHVVGWESIRAFLALHYRFNTRIDTPFWKHCREKTNLADAERLVAYYQENGPDAFFNNLLQNAQDNVGGYLSLLVGMKVPYRQTWTPGPDDHARFHAIRHKFRQMTRAALTVRQSLDALRASGWTWQPARAAASPRM